MHDRYLFFGSSYTKKIQATIVFAFALFVCTVHAVSAANLVFSPNNGSYQTGSTFSVGVFVQSPADAVNAVSGKLAFNPDLLEVVSLSKSASIVSLWVQEPSFSNVSGSISFEGITLNPGFTGASGKILTVTFKAKQSGVGKASFTTGSVLANDGNGTNVLSSMGSAQFTIVALPASTTIEQKPTSPTSDSSGETTLSSLPTLPVVTSGEFSSADTWSNKTNSTFTFTYPSDVVAIRLLVDDKPDTTPTVVYEPPISSRDIKDIAEGVSYLHVQYKNAQGWGAIEHRVLQVDTHPPEDVTVTETVPGLFTLDAKDTLSGIAYYEIQIDAQAPFRFIDPGTHTYSVPTLASGSHSITVIAYDRAGNKAQTQQIFTVVPSKESQQDSSNTFQTLQLPHTQQWLDRAGIFVIVLSVLVPSLALILLLCGLLYIVWRSLGGIKKHVDKEVLEAKMSVYKAFSMLQLDLEADIETLKKASTKRKLTREESKIIKRLQKNIREAEKVIISEISDIDIQKQG